MTEDLTQPEIIEEPGGIFASKGKVIVATVILLGVLGYGVYMTLLSATVYSYTVSELTSLGPTPEGKLVRVNGSLVEDSFVRPDGSTMAHFTLTDKDDHGVLPDACHRFKLRWRPPRPVLQPPLRDYPRRSFVAYRADGVFDSQNVLVKCPSKYILKRSQ